MKRFVGLTLAFSGAVLGVFLVNLILYSYNPQYHEALEAAVAGDSHIPVVTADGKMTDNVQVASGIDRNKTDNSQVTTGIDEIQTEKNIDNVGVPLAASYEEAQLEETIVKPTVVDKEYHEDCGTGEGYWIIRYSDGSVEVE